jgi:hypothetical protein
MPSARINIGDQNLIRWCDMTNPFTKLNDRIEKNYFFQYLPVFSILGCNTGFYCQSFQHTEAVPVFSFKYNL